MGGGRQDKRTRENVVRSSQGKREEVFSLSPHSDQKESGRIHHMAGDRDCLLNDVDVRFPL